MFRFRSPSILKGPQLAVQYSQIPVRRPDFMSEKKKRFENSVAFRSSSRLETWFISSLAFTRNCHKLSLALRSSVILCKSNTHRLLRRKIFNLHKRWQHSQVDKENDAFEPNLENEAPENHTRQELLELVDYYNSDSIENHHHPESEHSNKNSPLSENSYDTLRKSSENPVHNQHPIPQIDPETREILQKLHSALKIHPYDLDYIFKIYRALPDMRVNFLDPQTRHKLLHVLSVVEFKNEESMIRYLSVIQDIKALGIDLTTSEWNSAISFVARYTRVTSVSEVEAALQMWKQMEHAAGVKGDNVTFQILFDVACRAGKFVLAEMIYKEMESRGIEYTRYHYVSKIMCNGWKQDGDGVRAAYRELIDAGEIVDTVVLNAMISALIKAREPHSAENLYQRMKMAHLARANPPSAPQDFHSRRRVAKALLLATKLTKNDKRKRDELQKRSIIAPDSITYLTLIEYFAVYAGNLDKTIVFLEEMKWFSLPVHGAIFVKLFRGFFAHGRAPYSSWTSVRLELVFRSFISLFDSNETDIFITWWTALWMLKAFRKCIDAKRALLVWEELKTRWKPDISDMDHLSSELDRLIILNRNSYRRDTPSFSGH